MKKISLTGSVLLLTTLMVAACDYCNCYVSIDPNYNKNVLGLRYRYSSYIGEHSHSNGHSNHDHGHGTAPSPTLVKELYATYEIWGRLYASDKIQLLLNVPYGLNKEFNGNSVTSEVNGLGDPLLIARYQLFNSLGVDTNKYKHRLFAGGGLRLPLGVYTKETDEGLDPLFQPGIGTFSLIGSATYLAKWKRWGMSNTLVYQYSGPNPNDYLFAPRLNLNHRFFYEYAVGRFKILPNTGVYTEYANMDSDAGEIQVNTGGYATFYTIGIDFYSKRLSLNTNFQIVASENLYGDQGRNRNRLAFGISYAL